MDAFASKDKSTRRAGQAPGRGKERYATLFTVVSSVRELIAMGRIAVDSNELGDRKAIKTWFSGIEGHRVDNGRPTMNGFGKQSSIRSFSMSKDEIAAMDEMAGGCLNFLPRATTLTEALAPIDQAAQILMSQLHEGGGSNAY